MKKLLLNNNEVDVLLELFEWVERTAKDENKVETIKSINHRLKASVYSSDEFPYLRGLDESVKEFFFNMKEEYGLNLYHSLASVIKNNGLQYSTEEHFTFYKTRYHHLRPKLFIDESKLRVLLVYVHARLQSKSRR